MTAPDNDDQASMCGHQSTGGRTEDPPGWVDGLPTSGRDQSCAICGDRKVAWVHRLDADDVRFRMHGKGYTLPTFWTLCQPCEDIYSAGDHTAIAQTMRTAPDWIAPDAADDEHIQAPLGAFIRADRGRRALTD